MTTTGLQRARVLITGGTGFLGTGLVKHILENENPSVVIALSRGEWKQAQLRQRFGTDGLRTFLGDVRDLERLRMAFRGVNVVIHCAALKRVDACARDPYEAIQTNVLGTHNVIRAALDCGVEKVVFISSDKAAAPLNGYGKTKACAEDLILSAGVYSGAEGAKFAACRYGNVAFSTGSVIPAWRDAISRGETIKVTDPDATRFWFTLEGAIGLIMYTLRGMRGGELIVPKLPSFKVMDLARALSNSFDVIGYRDGDKKHELMVSRDEAPYFTDAGDKYVRGIDGPKLPDGFEYSSGTNTDWLTVEQLRTALEVV